MTDNEREQVLKMIADGKISAEEGLKLMNALDQDSPEDALPVAPARPVSSNAGPVPEYSHMDVDPRIQRVKSVVQRLWQIPLWIGIGIIMLSALGMAALGEAGKLNFWFFFLILPLLIGVGIIALAVGSRQARWLFVDVQQKSGEKPHHIFLGFPVPFKLIKWGLRIFGGQIDKTGKVKVDEILAVVDQGLTGEEPLIVNVDEGEDGDRVKVYIG